MNTTDSLLGQRLDEYQVETLLGKGGMARVYRGVDVHLRRYVAIKVIDTPYRSDSAYGFRFEREAQAIAQLEHPHIVRLYRYGEKAGLFYMAMQYIEGLDLQTVLDSYKESGDFMEPQDASRLAGEIGSALDYVHAHGVIHRDIKPSNIMLNKQGQAVLTDFGLALLTEVGTRGEVLGSPTHIAPEQAVSSAKAVPQSDLYALGVILYEMFTNRLPFYAEDPLDLAMKHMSEPPPAPRSLRSDLSPAVEAVILRAMAKEPEERYQSGAALAEALETALHAQAEAPLASVPRLSVLKRVEEQVAEQPLPPIPAAAAQPAGQPPSEPRTPPLPPLPAAVSPPLAGPRPAAHALSQLAAAASSPAGAQAVSAAERPASQNRLPVGILLGGLVVVICLGLGLGGAGLLRLLLGGQETAQPAAGRTLAATTPAAQVAAVTSTPLAVETPGAPLAPLPTVAERQPSASPRPTEPGILSSATPAPVVATLRIVGYREDGFLLVNESEQPFLMTGLRLGDGDGAILGSEWGLESLDPGDCVAALKDKGNPDLPEVDCQTVVDPLRREAKLRFWKERFNVYYNELQVAVCEPDDEEEWECEFAFEVR
jgi:serine/threonine protein kinase